MNARTDQDVVALFQHNEVEIRLLEKKNIFDENSSSSLLPLSKHKLKKFVLYIGKDAKFLYDFCSNIIPPFSTWISSRWELWSTSQLTKESSLFTPFRQRFFFTLIKNRIFLS